MQLLASFDGYLTVSSRFQFFSSFSDPTIMALIRVVNAGYPTREDSLCLDPPWMSLGALQIELFSKQAAIKIKYYTYFFQVWV